MDDSEEFFRLAGDERAAATMRFDCPHAWEESDQHLADYLSEGNCTFALGFQQEEKLFGVFAFKAEAESDSEDLSQMLVSEQRGHSLGNHIISDMVELPRTEKWYKALWVYIPKRNTAFRRMIERSGFNEKERRRYPCMTEDLAIYRLEC